MVAEETMLGDGAQPVGTHLVKTLQAQIADAERDMREVQRQLSKKADEVFHLKWQLFATCPHDWVVDRDDISIFPGSPKLCTRCNMYDHGPRKQFF